ncbi:MAG: hypothetical protein IPN49_15015 [Saprospiraceae bacterium]|nr:hypothetical protein [Saprospiraceae bacterium]
MSAQSYDNTVILDMQIAGGKTTMIDYNGKVMKVFSAEEKVKVTEETHNTFASLSMFSSFVQYNFDDGPLPVQAGKNWYLYDKSGILVQDFGNRFFSLTKPSEGIYRVYEPIEGKNGSYMLYYIDRFGKELFSGNKFWEATSFKNNIAFAQIRDKNGEWVKLDAINTAITSVDPAISTKIYNIKRTNKNRSIATLNAKSNYGTVIIDNDVNIVFDANKKVGKNNTQIVNVEDNITICANDYTYYFFDSLNNMIKKIYPLLGIKGVSSNMIFTRNDEYFDNLFYHDFSKVDMKLPEGNVFICDHLDENYVGGIVIDTINRSSKYTVFDNKTLEKKATSDKTIGTLFGERLIEIDPEYRFDRNLVSIIDFNGKVIYRTNPSDKIFQGIKSTLSYDPKDIQHIELKDNEDISGLSKFKNLTSIKFSRFTFGELPKDIKKFKKLEEINLYECNNLTSLPKWLKKYKNLTELHIIDCKKIGNLEDKIEQHRTLKRVYTMNYHFKPGFETEMKEKNPSLTIDSWHGMNGMEGSGKGQ